jgi:hypothetical protein
MTGHIRKAFTRGSEHELCARLALEAKQESAFRDSLFELSLVVVKEKREERGEKEGAQGNLRARSLSSWSLSLSFIMDLESSRRKKQVHTHTQMVARWLVAARQDAKEVRSGRERSARVRACDTLVPSDLAWRRFFLKSGNALRLVSKLRPQIRQGYPVNLSISLAGGKETNKDALSNCE